MDMADRMAEDGFRDVGYEYICITVSYEQSNKLQFLF